MSKIEISFYGENLIAFAQKSFKNLKEFISQKFLMSMKDVNEFLFSTTLKNQKVELKSEEDYQKFIKIKDTPLKLNIEISEKSQLYAQCESQINQKINVEPTEEEKQQVHWLYTCSGCGASPIKGLAFKCKNCYNFCYCEKCKNEKKHDHALIQIHKPVLKKEVKQVRQIHWRFSCNGCGNNKPIEGNRYKCKLCYNFNYCENCHSNLKHDHPMELVNIPMLNKNLKVAENEIKKDIKMPKSGFKCEGCGVYPISGVRFQCMNCANFNYCEKCEAKFSEKHGHLFIKYRK